MRLERHSSRFVNLRHLFSVITLLRVIRWLGVLYLFGVIRLFGVLVGRSHKLKTLETDSKPIPRYADIIFPLLELEVTLYQNWRAFTEIFSDQLRLSIPSFHFDKTKQTLSRCSPDRASVQRSFIAIPKLENMFLDEGICFTSGSRVRLPVKKLYSFETPFGFEN